MKYTKSQRRRHLKKIKKVVRRVVRKVDIKLNPKRKYAILNESIGLYTGSHKYYSDTEISKSPIVMDARTAYEVFCRQWPREKIRIVKL